MPLLLQLLRSLISPRSLSIALL